MVENIVTGFKLLASGPPGFGARCHSGQYARRSLVGEDAVDESDQDPEAGMRAKERSKLHL